MRGENFQAIILINIFFIIISFTLKNKYIQFYYFNNLFTFLFGDFSLDLYCSFSSLNSAFISAEFSPNGLTFNVKESKN